MKIPLLKGEYIKAIEVNDDGIDVQFAKKKKVALTFISINNRYWPYVKQVIEDCKKNFLPHHEVEYLVWSDVPEKNTEDYERIAKTEWWSREQLTQTVDYLRDTPGVTLYPTEGIDWPAPTLMRYHLFLDQEEKLKEYDYVFYLDADMRVVEKISDEIFGPQLTAAPHPGYVLNSRLIPPYEPNKDSAAYIPRLGQITQDEKGQRRFIPFYAAGGFQGGVTGHWIEAMKLMKEGIDKDFNNNYTAIWNDESHWNKFLWHYQQQGGDITFLDVSYIYPDSLIKEYYEPMWGRSYTPKIVTITKPFSLSKQGGDELNAIFGNKADVFHCPTCGDGFAQPGFKMERVVACTGKGQPHQLDMRKQ